MVSVSGKEECPVCGKLMEYHSYYKIGELFCFCPYCGYKLKRTVKRDEKGNIIEKPNPGDSKYFEDRFYYETEENNNPAGCFFIENRRGGGSFMCLEEPVPKEAKENFINNEDVVDASISMFNKETKSIDLEIIKGKGFDFKTWEEDI